MKLANFTFPARFEPCPRPVGAAPCQARSLNDSTGCGIHRLWITRAYLADKRLCRNAFRLLCRLAIGRSVGVGPPKRGNPRVSWQGKARHGTAESTAWQ